MRQLHPNSLLTTLDQQGFTIAEQIFPAEDLHALSNLLAPLHDCYGERSLFARFPLLSQQLQHSTFLALLAQVQLQDTPVVRSLYFDKPPSQNWQVPWHQDRVIAVAEKCDLDGFRHWTKKDGFWQVEPPLALLQSITIVRIALDAADGDNGALQVVPASHMLGAVQQSDIATLTQQRTAQCDTRAGDVVVMKQLLLHRSDKSRSARPRRILHLEFCAADLPAPLRWSECTFLHSRSA